jgi:hypothetical protein
MNSEKDQEISVARQRIEELEGLVIGKQKEVTFDPFVFVIVWIELYCTCQFMFFLLW